MFLFHHLKVIKEQGEENERRGKDKSVLLARFYEKASLDENRGQMLLNVALQCERELEELDRKAQLIINDFRARHFPDGVYRGQGELPPPPPELAAMQQERNAIVLRARNRLRGVMGEQDFDRLNVFVGSEIAASVKAIKAN